MNDWYYLKHRKPVLYGCDILTDPVKFSSITHKNGQGKNKYLRFIRRKFIGDYMVSTIFLGLDHNHFDGEPLLFETMVFKGDSMSELHCERCSTHRQALKQHKEVIERVKNR